MSTTSKFVFHIINSFSGLLSLRLKRNKTMDYGHGAGRDYYNTGSSGGSDPYGGYSARPDDRYARPDDRYARPDDRYARPDDRYARPDDRYARPDDRYSRPDDRYGSSDDRYSRSDDRYGRPGDRYGRQDDGYSRANDSYARSNDRYERSDDRYGRQNDIYDRYARSDDRYSNSYGRSDDGYRRSTTDNYHRAADNYDSRGSDRYERKSNDNYSSYQRGGGRGGDSGRSGWGGGRGGDGERGRDRNRGGRGFGRGGGRGRGQDGGSRFNAFEDEEREEEVPNPWKEILEETSKMDDEEFNKKADEVKTDLMSKIMGKLKQQPGDVFGPDGVAVAEDRPRGVLDLEKEVIVTKIPSRLTAYQLKMLLGSCGPLEEFYHIDPDSLQPGVIAKYNGISASYRAVRLLDKLQVIHFNIFFYS